MKTILAAALLTLPQIVGAQTGTDPTPGATAAAPRAGGLLGQAGSLLSGSGVPAIGSIGAGNAAGLLGYCVKNKLLDAAGTTGATNVLGRLTGHEGVESQSGFAAGQAGQVQTPAGQTLSLGSLRGQVKTRLCSLVLSRARSFL